MIFTQTTLIVPFIILQADPFKSLDDLAVGQLVQTGIHKCREATGNAAFDCSILDGDHTSDPRYHTVCNISAHAGIVFVYNFVFINIVHIY